MTFFGWIFANKFLVLLIAACSSFGIATIVLAVDNVNLKSELKDLEENATTTTTTTSAPGDGKVGFGPTDQEWGHVTVRENANVFWWLHYTTADADPTTRPLVIWLQGGPGASSSGYGNFMEVGPLTVTLEARNSSWTNNANVLFVDNPVGTGFSYVTDNSYLTTNNSQIANDFLVLMKNFYQRFPKFENVPLYIFSESYGGKMTAEIALVLYEETQKGNIKCNLTAVGLGDAWISPVEMVLDWAPFLFKVGAVDEVGYEKIAAAAEDTKAAFERGEYTEATNLWAKTEYMIMEYTYGVDFYNILTKIAGYNSESLRSFQAFKPGLSLRASDDDLLYELMNGPVKTALNIDQNWQMSSSIVFNTLSGDFMKPVTDIVERLLNETNIEVVVYNGQLDLIVDTPATVSWVTDLNWDGSERWKTAARTAFAVDGYYEGYYKNVDKLHFYWVNRAGHMVPIDNPGAMEYILSKATKNYVV